MKIDYFESKKILIIIPHQDDEIHLAGSIIASLKDTRNIYVAYTTSGDYAYNASVRYKEAIKSLWQLGKIKRENIFFLAYPDQSYEAKEHIYTTKGDYISANGHSETYSPSQKYQTLNYQLHNKEAKYNKENLEKNIQELILKIKPEIIICNDLDFHPDHIMTSILFEKALGKILKSNKEYRPIVLKGFTYENCYFGPDDLFEQENEMKFQKDKSGNLISNQYYNIQDSLKINISPKCYTQNLFANKIFKAILKHKSQNLVSHTTRMINTNQVYWKRNTNNLLFNAQTEASSGNKEYLNDFSLSDTDYILNGNKVPIKYNQGIWIPDNDDNEKRITITFDNKEYVECIKLYNGLINKNYIKEIEIKLDNKKAEKYTLEDKLINSISIKANVEKIEIKVIDDKCSNGFSEIEAFSKPENSTKENEAKIKNNTNILTKIIDKGMISLLTFTQKVYRKLFIKSKF